MIGRAAILSTVLLLAACREDTGPLYRSDTGQVPPSTQREGDPEAGYRALVNAPYVSCGIPLDAFRSVVPETAPAATSCRAAKG
jgi:hypothetical protein